MQNDAAIQKRFIAVLGFGILFGVGVMMNPDRSAAQASAGPAVTVVNTSSNPAPVTGATTVSGTVAATQKGSWNVGVPGGVSISGTPNVAVPGGVSINGTPSVNIANSLNSPIPVTLVSTAGQPFQRDFTVTITNNSDSGDGNVTTVPAGKRLVIEYASVYCSVVPPGNSAAAYFVTSVGGNAGVHVLPVVTVQGGLTFILTGQQVRWYADQLTDVTAHVNRSFTNGFTPCAITISGFLTPM